ncbi:MAG: AAA family ATPase, partial [Succinivibrio sp.]|nr:AAA family ATPase [Succinivibrio sp.]
MTQLQPLSNAITSFEEIRRGNAIYVDKTGLLGSFLTTRAPVFISRPRRFGKSLLCSTLRSFFTHGIEYFKGLELERWWQEQPENIKQDLSGNTVLSLDFSKMDYDDALVFKSSFKRQMLKRIKEVAPDFLCDDTAEAKDMLDDFLDTRQAGSVVLLIDEYDAPVSHFLDKPHELWKVRITLDNFYRMLKSQAEKLRFFFLTGVSRVTKIGVFSGFNNVWDLTLSGKYATLLGYTEKELHRCFDPHIRQAAEVLQQTPEEIYSALEENYDGFRFTYESEATLHNPWSVLKFLNEPERGFVNYWYESGGLSTSLNVFFARRCSLNTEEMAVLTECSGSALDGGMVLNIDDKTETITPDYDPTLMLCQAGYLTIREVTDNSHEDHTLMLGPSNNEVLKSLRRSLRDMVSKGLSTELRGEIKKIKETLLSGDLKKLSYIFECYLNSWTFDNKTLTSENACRGLIATWLQAAGFEVITEAHSAGGRCDLLLTIPEAKLRYAFEFKVQHQGENPDKR